MLPVSNNTIRVKQINVELVKNALKSLDYATMSTLAGITGLSVATCGTILKELLQTGEVLETEMEEPNGGRPARRYKYNADYSYIVCLNVKTEGGLHSLTYAVANLLGEIADEQTLPLDHIDYEVIEGQIGQQMERYGNIKAVGIGIPGVAHNGIVGVCDIAALVGIPLGPWLQEKYGLEVTIENDMHLTVYGFYKIQNYAEHKTFAIVTFPKDHFPGAGFIVDGHLLKGNTKFAGEVSFLPFDLSREEQLEQINSNQGFVPLAVKTITSIIAIIDPVSIALTGALSKPELLADIYNGCLKDIPKEHMPDIYVQNDTHVEYLNGLISITLESLAYKLQLVEKRR